MQPRERRHHLRYGLDRAVKVRLAEGGRYLTGRTRNVSEGGCLITLDHPRLLPPGQEVDLVIAWRPEQALLSSRQSVKARVVRSLGLDGQLQLALSFDPTGHADILRATA